MSSWVSLSVQFLSLIFRIILWFLWEIVDMWKNLVFLSPSWSHCNMDFCLHIFSSWMHLSSHSCWRWCSSFFFSSLYPSSMRDFWRSLIFLSNSFLAWTIFLKTYLFHCLIWPLTCFSLDCSLYIFYRCTWVSSFHQFLMFSRKEGWFNQNPSNLKGRFLGVSRILASSMTD